jgi:hypothetical protein
MNWAEEINKLRKRGSAPAIILLDEQGDGRVFQFVLPTDPRLRSSTFPHRGEITLSDRKGALDLLPVPFAKSARSYFKIDFNLHSAEGITISRC